MKQSGWKIETIDKYLANKNLEFASRLLVTFYMLLYGVGKIFKTQLSQSETLSTTQLKDLSGFDLTWAFFGYSYQYVLIIATVQIIGGILLIFNKTKLVGSILLYPILLNIILIDIFYKIPHGALANAIVFLLCITLVLYNHRSILFKLFQNIDTDKVQFKSEGYGVKNILIIILLLFILLVFQTVINFLLNLWL